MVFLSISIFLYQTLLIRLPCVFYLSNHQFFIRLILFSLYFCHPSIPILSTLFLSYNIIHCVLDIGFIITKGIIKPYIYCFIQYCNYLPFHFIYFNIKIYLRYFNELNFERAFSKNFPKPIFILSCNVVLSVRS